MRLFPKQPSSVELQQRILSIYDHLYANSPKRTPGGIAGEVGKILHAGMFLEEARSRIPAFNFGPLELRELSNGSNAHLRHLAAEVKQTFSEMNGVWAIYSPHEHIQLNDFDIAFTCAQLNGISISNKQQDVFGDALEIIRSEWAKRVGGQFFTDPRVTHLAMTLLEFDPTQGDDLVDICAGTGGFLLAGINHLRFLLESTQNDEPTEARVVDLACSSIHGQEVDDEVCHMANATLAARLGRLDHALVTRGDSLELDAFADGHAIRLGAHRCAATNPPFGTKITIKDPRILTQFELATTSAQDSSSPARFQPRPPDILMLERNVRLLVPGIGRLAIVLPYQLLSGPQALYVRRWLLQNAELIAVVDLPSETFQPHTGTKTALLIVQRRPRPLSDLHEAEDRQVFMSMPQWIGHDRRGKPVFRRAANGALTSEILSDFNQVADAFLLFKRGDPPHRAHEHSFATSLKGILEDPLLRINALYHRPPQNASVNGARGRISRRDWRCMHLEDVVDRIFFPTRFKRNYVDYFPGAVPFLGGSNISELVVTAQKWLRPDDPKLESLRVRAGWILITRSGSTGIVSTVPPAWDGYAMSEHVIRIVPDPSKLEPGYLQAVLRTRLLQDQISRGVFGSVIDEITPEFLRTLGIPIPADDEFLVRIAREVRNAEESRQRTLESIAAAVDELNLQLTGDTRQYVPAVRLAEATWSTMRRRQQKEKVERQPQQLL